MESDNQSAKKKILIIDDNPEIIDILGNTLSKDHKRQIALSGEKALEHLTATNLLPDLILLDVILPGMNGYEVCRCLKNDVKLKHIPIIFISSLSQTFDKVKAFKVGGVDYITKPFQREEVIARVAAHLEIAHSRKEIQDLYSQTLQGALHVMNDMLSMANPDVSRISNIMRLYADMILEELAIKDAWDLKLACLLSGIGMLAENMEKKEIRYYTNTNYYIYSQDIHIVFDTNKVFNTLKTSIDIISNIPKIENVKKIILSSMCPLQEYTPMLNMNMETLKGHILRILIKMLYNNYKTEEKMLIIDKMRNDKEEVYVKEVLDALTRVQEILLNCEILEVNIDQLEPRMILANDIKSLSGTILLKKGCELSETLIIILKHSKELRDLKIKIKIKNKNI